VVIQEPPSVPVNKTQESFGKLKENAEAEINYLLDIQIQQDGPNIQQEPFHAVKVYVIPETTQQPSSTPPAPSLPATKILSTQELKQADHSTTILASIRSQVPSVVKDYLGSNLPNAFQKVLRSYTEELKKELSEKRDYEDAIEQSVQANVINKVKNFLPKFLPQAVKEALEKNPPSLSHSSFQGQSAIQATESLSKYELKKILYEKMHKIRSNLTHNIHQELYDALTWSMLLDEANMKKGDKPDTVLKKRDRGDDQDDEPSAGSNQGKKTKKRIGNESKLSKKTSTTKESSKGKSLARTYKSGKSMTAKESVEEPVFDIASNDVEKTVDDKILKKDWFKKSPRPETLDLDWNTVETVDDALEQPCTPMDFSAFAMNRLKLNKIIRANIVGPVFHLLKGTCKICVELEYNMEECYRALIDQLDWANPEGHKSPVNMSKPLPLQDKEERTYSSSITKMLAARYTLEGIEDMILTLWSPVIITNDKDVALGISYWRTERQ
ncbi:hypothetical protein Tco_0588403, partial [Tanacetum coccineum]